jgi:hypothetical protein
MKPVDRAEPFTVSELLWRTEPEPAKVELPRWGLNRSHVSDCDRLDVAAGVSGGWSKAGQPAVQPIDLGTQEESTVPYLT